FGLSVEDLLENDFDFDGDALRVVSVDEFTEFGAKVELRKFTGNSIVDNEQEGDDKETTTFEQVVFLDQNDVYGSLGASDIVSDTFTYTIEDETGLQATATVEIVVLGDNDGPQLFIEDEYSVEEGFDDVIFAAFAGDVENDAITYSLAGEDASFFTINAQTGDISFVTPPTLLCDIELCLKDGLFLTDGTGQGEAAVVNYEGGHGDDEECSETFDITVIASDGRDTDSQDVTITVTEAPEPVPAAVRINEFHYDNAGTDEGEFVEIRAIEGTDVTGHFVELVNGSNGTVYDTLNLSSATKTTDNGFDYYVFDLPTNGLQNGAPDGIALGNADGLIEFVSYEGDFAATAGVANGVQSTDIGEQESNSTPTGTSVQRNPFGDDWFVVNGLNSKGNLNFLQVTIGDAEEAIVAPAPNARINEFHYDNSGTDEGEFIEVRTEKGADVHDMFVQLYNGSNGNTYGSQLALPGAHVASDDEFDYYVLKLPSNGIQNGSPDGIALVDDGTVIEFLSYEGSFMANNGPAVGMTSMDIGVAEPGSTPVGFSLQRNDDGSWREAEPNTEGAANTPPPEVAQNLLISEIQGEGSTSDFEGELVTVTAIVVGDFQNGDADDDRNLNGFFLQEELVDSDGNDLTSEGIFVFDGNVEFGEDVNIGDRVTVQGRVEERFGKTEIAADRVHVLTPDAIADINTMAATINLDAAQADDNNQPDLEAFESMLVTIEDTLTINEMFNLDRFNEIRLTAGERPKQFTQENEPDVAGFKAHLAEIGSDQIVFDDGLTVQNAPIFKEADLNGDGVFDTSDDFNMGDTITGLTGVLDFAFGDYRVRSAEDDVNQFENTAVRDISVPDVGGELTVVSFNVLNFFTTLDEPGNPGSGPNNLGPRGADNKEEFDRQLDKLVTALLEMDADIFGLVELENEFGGDQNGDGQFAIGRLVDELNAEVGSITYAYVDPGRPFVDTGDAISVGMIYKPDSVTVNYGSVEILDDADLPGLGLGDLLTDGGVFDGPSTNRAPLAATFTDNGSGEDFTVAVTHMKSKGGNGNGGDEDIGDGAGAFNETRTEGVEALKAWLDEIGDKDDGETGDILALGDFNAYAKEDPIDAMLAGGYINLEETFDPGSTTFVFDGQTGTLDYAFANTEISNYVTGAKAWQVNSSEPDAIDYNLDFGRDKTIFDGEVPFRNSDHDPILIGLDFTPTDDAALFV
ncbi:MAG: ExeM/NucH family extracellular endonuclease, partial [Pseudomonadota bacterium]